MCDMYLVYYEDTNFFVDEYGEIVYDIFDVITPNDLYLFKYNPVVYHAFPFVKNDCVMIHMIFIPKEGFCSRTETPILDLEDLIELCDRYDWKEQCERRRMAKVTG